MRRLIAAATLVALGLATTAYADDLRGFTLAELRADAHKGQQRTPVDESGIPLKTVSDKPCVDGLAGDTKFACDGIDLLSFMPQSEFGGSEPVVDIQGGGNSDLWGWTDPQDGGEYVIMGKTNGVGFFNVTDPKNPVYLGDLPNPSPGQLIWHDIKVYDNHAFITSETVLHGMTVFDLTKLRGVTEPQEWTRDGFYDESPFSYHNLAINEDTGFAYLVGGNNGLLLPDQCNSGLHMVDINDPTNPTFAGCHSTGEGGGQLGLSSYIHDTQCVTYDGPDTRYTGKELCFNSSEDHMSIVDVTEKSLLGGPEQIGLNADYEDIAYAHQGWLTADKRYFLMGDELDEGDTEERTRTLVFDVTDLENPEFVGEHTGTTAAIDHNMYELDGLFYQSNYAAGLQVLDPVDLGKADLEQVAEFDGFPAHDDPEFVGTWSNYPYFESGTIAFSGIDEGLFLVCMQDDCPPEPEPGTGTDTGTGTGQQPTTGTGQQPTTAAAPARGQTAPTTAAPRARTLPATGGLPVAALGGLLLVVAGAAAHRARRS